MNVQSTLQWLQNHEAKEYAVLGFDTFIDRICRKVSGLGGKKMHTMTDLGTRIVNRQDHSGVVSLENIETRLGGNMPNTANVLSELGARVSCIGAFGKEEIYPIFRNFARKCEIKSYADPGTCLALEFEGSKLFLGENGILSDITWENLADIVGMDYILKQYDRAQLIGLFNWGELNATQWIWEGLLRDVFPMIQEKRRDFFIDFSDMSARSREDIQKMRETLKKFRRYGRVIVSLNAAEKESIDYRTLIQEGCVDAVILHTASESSVLENSSICTLPTRLAENPAILTGSGDSFNGGFCFGILSGLPLEDCLKIANATAGCYIRRGMAPTKAQMMDEIKKCEILWR